MEPHGPRLFDRLLGYVIVLITLGVLLQEFTRLVRAYAGWLLLGLICVLIISLLLRRFRY